MSTLDPIIHGAQAAVLWIALVAFLGGASQLLVPGPFGNAGLLLGFAEGVSIGGAIAERNGRRQWRRSLAGFGVCVLAGIAVGMIGIAVAVWFLLRGSRR